MTEQGATGQARGWYPDPWSVGQHRFWTGSEWTADVFPSGPGVFVHPPAPSGPPPTAFSTSPLPPPEWRPDAPAPLAAGTTLPWAGPVVGAEPPRAVTPEPFAPQPVAPDPVSPQPVTPLPSDVLPERAGRPSVGWLKHPAVLTAIAAVVALVIGYVATSAALGSNDDTAAPVPAPVSSSPTPAPAPLSPATVSPSSLPSPSSSPAPGSAGSPAFGDAPPTAGPSAGSPAAGGPSAGSQSQDPDADSLGRIVVRQSDVDANSVVGLQQDGDGLDVATLDLCNGTYPSESLRTARLQVDDADTTSQQTVLSTEAVLYQSVAAAQQAFSELESVTRACPSTPVTSPVGEPTVTTTLAPLGGDWPQVSGISREAWNVNATDTSGDATSSSAVYLRRGRVLLGLYFGSQGSAQPTIAGASTMQGIVAVFAGRLAALPSSVTGG